MNEDNKSKSRAIAAGKKFIEKASTNTDEKVVVSNNEMWCPLFMDGLPSDFSTNSSLAAIASLLDENSSGSRENHSNNGVLPKGQIGGGKVSLQRKFSNRSKPYSLTSKKKPTTSTLEEAQLFMKMWKI